MRVLCVAEKPSIAKAISQILSGGRFTTRATTNKFIKNYDFDYPQTNASFTVTCVSGHLTAHDFYDTHKKWGTCDPFELFDAPVETQITKDGKSIEKNLLNEARNANTLMIWTDCDREGEHIGLEVVRVCRKANRHINVKRARFSAIIAQQIHNAAQHPVELDRAQADAVEARIILDLKIGAAFTRLQTVTLQARFAQLSAEGNVVSYGPCQFPTLGFVVSRYNQVKSFIPEVFWYIYLSLSRPTSSTENEETHFTWRRGHLFDEDAALVIYEYVLSNPVAHVVKVTNQSTKKWKPLPLTTVELQKAGSRLLRLAPKKVLDVAEKLYQQGFLSYPRTETDQFDPQFDFMTLIDKQTVDPAWGDFATSLQQGGFGVPRKGKNNDNAHPPIHPTAHAGNLVGDEKRVYEFITRRFLACCSKDAEGWQTTVDVICGGEEFYATGLVVLEKNYLLVYPYDKWTGHVVPEFEEGEEFQPSVCELREGKTSKPNLLTEADLVGLMDKNGIGTDATIAQHIQMVIDRGYVLERMEGSTKYLAPSTLGIGLIEGYDEIGLNKSLSKPQLRRETERSMAQVCQGTKTKNDMVNQAIDQYKEMFITSRREFNKVVSSVRKYIEGNEGPDGRGDGNGSGGGGDDGDDEDPGGGNAGGRRNKRRGGPPPRGGGGPSSRRRGGARGGGKRITPRTSGGAAESEDVEFDELLLAPRNPARQAGSSFTTRQIELPTPTGQSIPPSNRQTQRSLAANPAVAEVRCRCNLPAIRRTIDKESASKGKQYWTCGGSSACNFFQWIDTEPVASGSSGTAPKTIPAKRSYSSQRNLNATNVPSSRLCKCDLSAVLRTSRKENENHGRKFWTCPNGTKDTRCKYFEWDDEPQASNGSSGDNQSRRAGGQIHAQPIGPCFKCDNEGHWASQCPGDGTPGGYKRSRSFGSKTDDNAPTDACYTCGQQGHFSKDCPIGGATSTSKPTSSATTSGACFKCGENGHWSNACPNENPPSRSASNSRAETGTKRRGAGRSQRGRDGKRKTTKFGAPDGY